MSAARGRRRAGVPPAVVQKIEHERRRLQRVSAVLACLTTAAMYDEEIDAADVATVARELLDAAIDGLDSVELR